MANNNYQHPPGLPLPFPCPPMQQPPKAPRPDGHPHAPPPPPGWNLPGLHQQFPPQPYAPQPARAENQHSLPTYPSAVHWPPPISPEWLHFVQNGMPGGMIPPPMPGLNFHPPPLPQAPHTSTMPAPFPPQFPPQHPAAPVERIQEIVDSDREDGEVSDAEPKSWTPAGIAVRQRYPEPPRSAPQPTAVSSQAEDGYNPDKPSAGQNMTRNHVPKAVPQAEPVLSETDLLQKQREEAKQFVRLLNSHNVGYHTLAKEKIDLELLRGLYRSMNLPSEPEPIPPPKTNSTTTPKASDKVEHSQATESVATVTRNNIPAVSTNVVAAPAASAAPSPVDRKDYLARLQAAKLARQSGPAKASPPQDSPPVTAAPSATGINTPQAIMTPTRKQPATDEQKARQTELIKQRLEALKAQSKQSVSTSSSTLQRHGTSQAAARIPQASGTNPPKTQPAAPSFPSIPGLFMNAPPMPGNESGTPLKQPQSVPQKRPAPSDTEVSTPRGSVTPYNRSFRHSPYTQQEDSMIIEVSDDESNGSDMDIDDDQGSSGPTVIRQAPVSIPGFPPRQVPVSAAQSAVSTPGPHTPGTLARTGELSTKEQELAALKQTLKKKLAEQKRIKEAAEAAAAASAAATQKTSETQVQATHRPAVPAQQPQATILSQNSKAPATAEVGSSTNNSSRERKRRRRTEIQEQLPSLDDEIASNEAQMAKLVNDLEQLKANNERIMQDKQRLTKELEDLGIDTEGMSHADMRATKSEIERAMSPTADSVHAIAAVSSQTSIPNGDPTAPVLSSVGPIDQVAAAVTPKQAPSSVSAQAGRDYGFLPGLGPIASQSSAPAIPYSLSQPIREPASRAPVSQQFGTDAIKSTSAVLDAPTLNDRASATPMDDDEDFYSPPPLTEVREDVGRSTEKENGEAVPQESVNSPSPSEEGEITMSESSEEEEEYEPDEPIEASVPEPIVQQAQSPQLQAEQSQSVGQSQVSTEDEEAYEPPDVDEEMAEAASSMEASRPEASSVDEVDDGAMDVATSSSEEDDSDSDSSEDAQFERGEPPLQARVTQHDTNTADDLAPELQPDTSAVATRSDDVPLEEEEPEAPSFTPYESPLRMFKSYRYHPNFSQDVDGGFLSMTYSHQIDPEKPLCPFESAGGSCNDPECPNQHFRGMGINGEKLLVQLGTANPGKTQDERQQWNNGLRSVLQDLRQKNIKDPNGIAREIAKYRREFLKDETRVVNL